MKKFNVIFEQYMIQNTPKEQQKQYRSLQEFKHFCDNINLFVQFINESPNFYIIKLIKTNDDKQEDFDYYYKFNPHYYATNKNIFDKLIDYKQKYIITVDGTQNAKKVLF